MTENIEEKKEMIEEKKEMIEEKKEMVCTAKCGMCGLVEKLTEEDMSWLADYAFKFNPVARGADLQDAYNRTRGPICKGLAEEQFEEADYHVSMFDKEWVENIDKMAVAWEEDVVGIGEKEKGIVEFKETDKKLEEEIQKLLKMKNEINLEKIPEMEKEKVELLGRTREREPMFKKYTGTNKYKLFLKVEAVKA